MVAAVKNLMADGRPGAMNKQREAVGDLCDVENIGASLWVQMVVL
jgi:hypothetical protein